VAVRTLRAQPAPALAKKEQTRAQVMGILACVPFPAATHFVEHAKDLGAAASHSVQGDTGYCNTELVQPVPSTDSYRTPYRCRLQCRKSRDGGHRTVLCGNTTSASTLPWKGVRSDE
jgi:hypothetical protein